MYNLLDFAQGVLSPTDHCCPPTQHGGGGPGNFRHPLYPRGHASPAACTCSLPHKHILWKSPHTLTTGPASQSSACCVAPPGPPQVRDPRDTSLIKDFSVSSSSHEALFLPCPLILILQTCVLTLDQNKRRLTILSLISDLPGKPFLCLVSGP